MTSVTMMSFPILYASVQLLTVQLDFEENMFDIYCICAQTDGFNE